MNKTELTAAVAAKVGLTKKDSEVVVNAFIDVSTEALQKGGKVTIIGFGNFEVRDRPARVARNPRTDEPIKIAAMKAPVFKAGKGLKDSVK